MDNYFLTFCSILYLHELLNEAKAWWLKHVCAADILISNVFILSFSFFLLSSHFFKVSFLILIDLRNIFWWVSEWVSIERKNTSDLLPFIITKDTFKGPMLFWKMPPKEWYFCWIYQRDVDLFSWWSLFHTQNFFNFFSSLIEINLLLNLK